jgi:hypothetical protein
VFAILQRGIRPDVEVEVAADMLGGSVVMRVLLTGDAITPRMVGVSSTRFSTASRSAPDGGRDPRRLDLRLGGEGGEDTDVAVHSAPNPGPHGPPEGGRTTRVDLPVTFDDVGDDMIPSRLGSQSGG